MATIPVNEIALFRVRGIVATSTGTTTLFTSSGPGQLEYFFPLLFHVSVGSIGVLVTPPTISVGTSFGGAPYTDIIPATALTGMTLNGQARVLGPTHTAVHNSVPINIDVILNVSVSAVAADYKLQCTIIGFFAPAP